MNRIRKLRREKELTLIELSKQVGIQHSTLSQYETGKREPKLETWEKIAKILDVSPAYLMGLEDSGSKGYQKEHRLGIFFGSSERPLTIHGDIHVFHQKMASGHPFTVILDNHEKAIINPNFVACAIEGKD